MRKSPWFFRSVICALAFVALTSPKAFAQADEEPVDDILATEELGEEMNEMVEAPPKPEPPYPGSEEFDVLDPVPAPAPTVNSVTNSAAPAMPEGNTWSQRPPPQPAQAPRAGVQRPAKVDEDGNYYYPVENESSRGGKQPGVAAPVKVTEEGHYVYDVNDRSTEPAQQPNPMLERPIEITSKGEYNYKLESKPSSKTASFRVGVMAPPVIKNNSVEGTTIDFKTIYSDAYQPVLMGDYEWRLTSKIGRLGIKFTSGVFSASGQGQFRKPNPEGLSAQERFTFLMFPNQLTGIYRFQYADKQVLVPYVEGGGAYFTYAEIRDDSKPPKFGGSLGLVSAAGVNFLLDWLDRRAIQRLDAEYGIQHVWLTAEARVVVGLNKDVDISSQAILAGVTFDF